MIRSIHDLAASINAALAELDYAAVLARRATGEMERAAAAGNADAVGLAHVYAGVQDELKAVIARLSMASARVPTEPRTEGVR